VRLEMDKISTHHLCLYLQQNIPIGGNTNDAPQQKYITDENIFLLQKECSG
jgi:hypothetical protein